MVMLLVRVQMESTGIISRRIAHYDKPTRTKISADGCSLVQLRSAFHLACPPVELSRLEIFPTFIVLLL